MAPIQQQQQQQQQHQQQQQQQQQQQMVFFQIGGYQFECPIQPVQVMQVDPGLDKFSFYEYHQLII